MVSCVHIFWLNFLFLQYSFGASSNLTGSLKRWITKSTGQHKTKLRDYVNTKLIFTTLFLLARQPPSGPGPPHSLGLIDHTQRRTTVGRTPLDEWTARRRDLYLTTHITHDRQTSMSPVRFESTISAVERSQTYALDRAANWTSYHLPLVYGNRRI